MKVLILSADVSASINAASLSEANGRNGSVAAANK